MPRATAPRLAALALVSVALAGCGFGEDGGQTTTTFPTLPPSSGVTTPPTTPAPPTAAPTTPPLTAPTGGPNTLPPLPDLVTTPPAATTATTAGPPKITYVDEPATGALRLGHKGSRVQTMQGQLLSLGYQLGVDGYFGRGTEAAVRQFQQAQGLPADGVASPPTIDRLAQVAPPG